LGAWLRSKRLGVGIFGAIGIIGLIVFLWIVGRSSEERSAQTALPWTSTPIALTDSPTARLATPTQQAVTDTPLTTEEMFPNSGVIYGAAAQDFDIATYISAADGALKLYTQYLPDLHLVEGAVVVQHVAIENSVNPRLLLALLEDESGVVFGSVSSTAYLLKLYDCSRDDLYGQLVCGVRELAQGYYGRRQGGWQELRMPDGRAWKLPEGWSAGQTALAYYFAGQDSKLTTWEAVEARIHEFLELYREKYGSLPESSTLPDVEPQPEMTLPFPIGETWYFTAGPHAVWENSLPNGALDLAPPDAALGCSPSPSWALAVAAGRVTRARDGVVALDLDGDGHEQTGWVVVYAHVADIQVAVGDWVAHDQRLGHPSCEGGPASGRHIHLVRKYNGEWMAAEGEAPFVLSGWQAHAGTEPDGGTLTRGDQVVVATNYGASVSKIFRD
jgi:LasA protease